jgi:hypothetical protein
MLLIPIELVAAVRSIAELLSLAGMIVEIVESRQRQAAWAGI